MSAPLTQLPHRRRTAPGRCDAFAHYNAQFRAITRRAPLRFDGRDWRGSQQDAIERIGLYDRSVNQTIAEVRLRLGAQALNRDLWRQIHGASQRRSRNWRPEFTKTSQLHQPQTVRHGGRRT